MIANVAEADEHVRTAKRYIYEQERLIERLADEGQNTDDAFGLLNLLNRSLRLFERYRVFLDRVSSMSSKAGNKAVFNVTAMERSILAELFERGGRGQLSGLRDRRPIERLVNKGFVERHTLNSQQEEYVLTAIGKKVLDNK